MVRDQLAYLNLITHKHDNYLKRLSRILTNKRCFGKLHHMRDYFPIVDLLAYHNLLNNPYSVYHPNMYHRQAKKEEFKAEIPYFHHAIQPFLLGLLDS